MSEIRCVGVGFKKVQARRIGFLAAACFPVLIGLWVFLKVDAFPGHQALKHFLMERLVKSAPVPSSDAPPSIRSNGAIYVLGGSAQSLEGRFKAAADLYKRDVARKILIDSEPQKMMGYNPSKGRNLNFNEWAIDRLSGLGVREADIEPVFIERGFFGTFTEAKGISRFALKKDFDALIMVSSRYHTMRVWECFSKFTRNTDLKIYVYMSNDDPGMGNLIPEFLKLHFYKRFLL